MKELHEANRKQQEGYKGQRKKKKKGPLLGGARWGGEKNKAVSSSDYLSVPKIIVITKIPLIQVSQNNLLQLPLQQPK